MPCEKCEPLLRKSFPFWEGLSENDKIDLMNGAGCAEFKKGQNIHNGTVCTGIIFVKTGCLRVYILSEEGKEITLYRIFEISEPGRQCLLQDTSIHLTHR